ncbi:MAG TPA: murein biosynthesis integral membrane protein MurJ [Candidatus Eisenbacteria bacterium]|nr:murein biosynthesis integral membrane protein MurJ [Candidatus Eisenbacteria bacterium]
MTTNDAPVPQAPVAQASTEARVAKSAGLVGAATLLSRVAGLMRDQVMATLFGAGFATDAFNVAFRIPNLLRDLFAEGAMSSAFVPTFTEYHVKRGEEEAWALGRQLMVWLLLLLLVICTLGWIFTPQLVRLFAGGFARIPGKLEVTNQLTRIMLPFLPTVALAAAAMGMLNARGRFGVPALAPTLLNVGMVAGGLALIPAMHAIGQPAIVAMAVGVVFGGLLQFGCQLPSLYRLGFRLRLEMPRAHAGVWRVGRLMLPAIVGLAGTQVNQFVSTVIASHLEQGSVSWLYFAFRLMQLPIGVFGVALATVSMTELARAAVAEDMPLLKRTLSATVRLVFMLTVPAAVWLAVMAQPVIAVLFEHGHFHADSTRHTADALVMYCIGLPAFAAVGVFTRTFYALGDTRVPVMASFVSVAVNITLNLLFIGPLKFLGLGHTGLALATSVTAFGNLFQLGFYLRRRVGLLEGRRILSTLLRVLIASGLIAAACWALLDVLGNRWHHGFAREGLAVGAGFVIAVGVGWVAMRVMRVEELHAVHELARGLARRFGR